MGAAPMQTRRKTVLSPTVQISSIIWLSHQSSRAQNGAPKSQRRTTPRDCAEGSKYTMERREFFQSLIAGGATVRQRGTHQKHSGGTVLYRGPMTIPEHVVAALAQNPGLYRTSGRGTHLLSRYADRERNGKGSGAVYIFRCQIPAHRAMVGEIVLSDGHYGVHCWQAADPSDYSEPLEIAARKNSAQHAATSNL